MDNLICEIRVEQDDSRMSPGRMVGTLLTYEQRAGDRPEIFVSGSLSWPENGILVREMHDRQRPILRAVPFLDGNEVKINSPIPDTQRGRDAVTNIREGVYSGLSVEFRAQTEGRRAGLREIRSAALRGAGLVDYPSYTGSLVEVRSSGLSASEYEDLYRWL